MPDSGDNTRRKHEPWKPGQSGNPRGRPKGARNKIDGAFLEALLKDFEEGGADAIRKCREEKPDVYLSVISRILPRHVEGSVDHTHDHHHHEAQESLTETREWLRRVLNTPAGSRQDH